jgi:hypothetical protein
MEPLSLGTAVVGLVQLLGQVVTQLDRIKTAFHDAPKTISDIRDDCYVTKSVLEFTEEKLNQLPADGDVSMASLLRSNVAQLKVEIDALLLELAKFNKTHVSKIAQLANQGKMAWKEPYLNQMYKKILDKRTQFQVIQGSIQA